ncbi:hypothetical protein LTR70_007558 [Exophiala xenobiotica]|uniref:Rhodopsin domain-containing protein n=1 Tax=Lithohypha guttulata TaxID=1690604 RepID=A0ABR0K7J3_9EURO|nr:hypothetical protein LTR24_005975 [Lithohypha guttulata]KAK5313574.1 hypothetical protein LTR70_007558 [Exophiala xenobiotica]
MPGADVESAIRDGRVPSDISATYLDQSRDHSGHQYHFRPSYTFTRWPLLARITILKRFGLDDALAVFAWAPLVPFVGLCYKLILIGSGRHYAYIQYVMPRAVVDASEVYDFAAHIIYTTSLLVCRLSGLALYYILVKQHHTYVLALRMIAAFIIMSYLPQLFLLIFHCLPVTGLWPYNWQLPAANEYKRLAWGIVYSVNTAVSLCNDFLLYGIPAVMIWRLDCRESGRSSSCAYYALESWSSVSPLPDSY